MAKKKFFLTKKDKEAQKKAIEHFNQEDKNLISGDEIKGGQWLEIPIKKE